MADLNIAKSIDNTDLACRKTARTLAVDRTDLCDFLLDVLLLAGKRINASRQRKRHAGFDASAIQAQPDAAPEQTILLRSKNNS